MDRSNYAEIYAGVDFNEDEVYKMLDAINNYISDDAKDIMINAIEKATHLILDRFEETIYEICESIKYKYFDEVVEFFLDGYVKDKNLSQRLAQWLKENEYSAEHVIQNIYNKNKNEIIKTLTTNKKINKLLDAEVSEKINELNDIRENKFKMLESLNKLKGIQENSDIVFNLETALMTREWKLVKDALDEIKSWEPKK